MDNETLQAIQQMLDKQEQRMGKRFDRIESDLAEVKQQVTKTGDQVDILYNWVDGIDLNVKSVTDIVKNIGKR